MRLVQGSTLEPLLPFFIMDVQFQIYCHDIAYLPVKYQMKQVRGKWIAAYNKFNKAFFNAFTQDEQDELIDKMDDFADYIQNDVMVAKVAFMDMVKDLPFERQGVIGACLMCNVLAQSAQVIWGKVYHDRHGVKETNGELRRIQICSYDFLNMYYREGRNISCDTPRITEAVNILCRKIVKWLYRYD